MASWQVAGPERKEDPDAVRVADEDDYCICKLRENPDVQPYGHAADSTADGLCAMRTARTSWPLRQRD
jgi:hypothetical protein